MINTNNSTTFMPSEKKNKQNLKYRNVSQAIAFSFLWLTGAVTIAALVWIVSYVMIHGFGAIDLSFLTTRPEGGLDGGGGMSTTIVTTLYLVVLTLAIATPLGVGSALYLVEYAGEAQRENKFVAWLISVARGAIEILSGVPSIIFGLFGYALFVTTLEFGFSLLSAGLSGACMVLPVIIRASEEALLAVPRSYREASLGLGATKWQSISQVVLPAAMPGITTGVILSMGRIIAETAIFWVTLGGSYRLPTSVMSAGRTMALHVYLLASETRAFDKAMGTGAILILTILALNLSVNFITSRYTARNVGKKQ